VGASQIAALNRGRHLYSAGRPSRWALAHISSFIYLRRYLYVLCAILRPGIFYNKRISVVAKNAKRASFIFANITYVFRRVSYQTAMAASPLGVDSGKHRFVDDEILLSSTSSSS